MQQTNIRSSPLWFYGFVILLLVVILILLVVYMVQKMNRRDDYSLEPSQKKSLKESGFYSLATMLQATFGSHIYLDPSDKNYVAFNSITPLPDSLEAFIKRKNIIETPNLDVIYAPSVMDLRNQAILLTLPPSSRQGDVYYIAQFISITAEDVATLSSKTNTTHQTEFVIYSSSYAPKCIDSGINYIKSPSSVLYMMIRVATDLQDASSYSQSLQFLRMFSLKPYSFKGLHPAFTEPLNTFKDTFPDLTPINVRDQNINIVDYYNLFVRFMPLQLEEQPKFWTKNFPTIGITPNHFEPTYKDELKQSLTQTQQFEVNISIKGIPVKNNYNTSQIFYVFNIDPIANQIEVVGRAWLYIFANPPKEAIYFQSTIDSNNVQLSGSSSYILPVPIIPKLASKNGFWSVCSYNKKGFNTVSTDFTVGKHQTIPTNVHISSNINDKTKIPNTDLFLLVPNEDFYIVFRVYAPDDSILLKGSDPFFPEMIQKK